MKLRAVAEILKDGPTLGHDLTLASGVELHFVARAPSIWDGISVWDIYHDDGGTLYAFTPNHDYGEEFVEAIFHDLNLDKISDNGQLELMVRNFDLVVAEMLDSIGMCDFLIEDGNFDFGDISFRFETVEVLFE